MAKQMEKTPGGMMDERIKRERMKEAAYKIVAADLDPENYEKVGIGKGDIGPGP